MVLEKINEIIIEKYSRAWSKTPPHIHGHPLLTSKGLDKEQEHSAIHSVTLHVNMDLMHLQPRRSVQSHVKYGREAGYRQHERRIGVNLSA